MMGVGTMERLPTNRENASIDFATRLHRGKSVKSRQLVGGKSRKGGVLRNHHFLNTEPSTANTFPAYGERTTGKRYAVKRRGGVVAVYTCLSQAENAAFTCRGYVEIL